MENLSPGDVVAMTSAQVLLGDPKGEYLRTSYKSKPSHRMVFLFLGSEPRSGKPPLDVVERLYALGWSHPEFKPET
jgi:hypothetical protein